jgi:hypothetical protein
MTAIASFPPDTAHAAPPAREPTPGGHVPSEVPPQRRREDPPDTGPSGPRTPYPVDDPGIDEPRGPGSEPDYLPGGPSNPMPRF